MMERESPDLVRADRPQADTVFANGQSASTSSFDAGHAILLIDDRPEVAGAMEIAFRLAGHTLAVATGPEEAFSRLAQTRFDAIVLDLNFTPGKTDGREGLACLARIMSEDPTACVIVLTAHGGIRTAVAAMQAGARDFAVKPWKNADLVAKVDAAIARSPADGKTATPVAASREHAPARILGESAAIEALRDMVRKIGPTMAGVAVTGPSGAGRTLTALALHEASPFAGSPPLRLDLREADAMAALPGTHGTVILRHADRLDPPAQDRLAAALSDAIRPIATIDDQTALTPALQRRIATIAIPVPALAGRREDILLLARHFLRDAADRFGRPLPRLTEAAETALVTADWPAEVRGLALAMERAALLAENGLVDAAILSLASTADPVDSAAPGARNFDLDRSEKAMIAAALAEHRHNVSRAAKALGLSRGALYRRMERHDL